MLTHGNVHLWLIVDRKYLRLFGPMRAAIAASMVLYYADRCIFQAIVHALFVMS